MWFYRNYCDERLGNQDISGISMVSNSNMIYIRLRISRDLCPNASDINTFLTNEKHSLIYKLNEEERIPFSQEVTDKIRDIVTINPETYIKAYTADDQYIVIGEYYCDTRGYIDTKAQLVGCNNFSGNQKIIGDIDHEGDLYTQGDYITIRHNQEDTFSFAQGAGIKISGMQLGKQAIIRMNKAGSLYAGLQDRMRKVPYSFDSSEKNGAFFFWDDYYGGFRSTYDYTIDTFLRQTITDAIVLSVDNWFQDNNRYKYTITNYRIKENSLVMVSYQDESKPLAQEVGVANYNPVVENATLTIIADNLPVSDIEIRLIIIGA